MLSEPGIKRALIAIGVAILAAGAFTLILSATRPGTELWDWLITLTATGLSALFAVGVFEYQNQRAEQDRQTKLLGALAAELQSNLDIIQSEARTPFFARIQQPETQTGYIKFAEAKLVPMPPVAAEAAIRSGVFDASDVYLLTRIMRELYVHNNEVAYLSAIRSNPTPIHSDTVLVATKELDERQERIEQWCEELIEFLRKEGIEVLPQPDQKDEPPSDPRNDPG